MLIVNSYMPCNNMNSWSSSNHKKLENRSLSFSSANTSQTDSYMSQAKKVKDKGDYKTAINMYNRILRSYPENQEVIVLLGDCYRDTGNYKLARSLYVKSRNIDPNFDLATRSLKKLDNVELAKKNPEAAKVQENKQAHANLNASLGLIKNFAPPNIVQALRALHFEFAPTGNLSGHTNIAQYEHSKKMIVVNDAYIWAAPEVIAPYIVHEAIHAEDKDPYTSKAEEKDAYRAAIEFWIKNNHGTKDPELDYAADLYLDDPKKLDARVYQIYSSRSAGISDKSPRHQILAKGLRNPNLVNELYTVYEPFLPKLDNMPENPNNSKSLNFVI